MLSKLSQSQKDRYCMIPLYEVLKIGKIIVTESRNVAARDLGGGQGRSLFNGYRIPVLLIRDEKS